VVFPAVGGEIEEINYRESSWRVLREGVRFLPTDLPYTISLDGTLFCDCGEGPCTTPDKCTMNIDPARCLAA
jgi:hypothetical protein